MERKYANPPIIEAVCEFRLTGDTQWDPTIPGMVYEIIRNHFPRKERKLVQEMNIAQTGEGVRQEVRTTERAWFLAEDSKSFIQVGPHLLAVNCLKPYLGWAAFKPTIEEGLRALATTLEMRGLERIGLRYVNRIGIPGPTVGLEECFAFRPFLGEGLPQNVSGFIVGCMLPFNEGRDSCTLQLTTGVPEGPESVAFVLDLDYFLAKAQTVPVNEALGWVEAAHRRVLEVFEGCITDRLRELFGEVK